MKYNSIGEYFYRLSNRCLGLVLFPVTVVLAAYIIDQYFFSGLPWLLAEEWLISLIYLTSTVMTFLFFFQYWQVARAIRPMRLEPSLGKRISSYIRIVMIRFRTYSLMLLLIGTGVFLTGDLTFLYLLPVPILLILLYWPFLYRMSKDLKLRLEERDILKNKSLGV
jgi:hypothetical protein